MEMEKFLLSVRNSFPRRWFRAASFSRLNDSKGQLKHCPTIIHVGLQLD